MKSKNESKKLSSNIHKLPIEILSDDVAETISGGLTATLDGGSTTVKLDESRLLFDIFSGNIKVTYK